MRIQHNIMAMNAYRNYNMNNKALSGNLEKLSSGYKINRAGDDAAGLAISEKMRAQITGLNAAQKNVKDGISLVKTAEGAMQEIQDMLNRMDYLATQSANGTYDNEVDRAALQKEVEQLKTEINRIADSANFNGIKLLDGSLDSSADMSTKADLTVSSGKLPDVGTILGTDTVLHADPSTATGGSSFSIDLHNVAVKNGDTLDITIGEGDDAVKLSYTTTADEYGSTLVQNIVGGLAANGATQVNGANVATNQTIQINGQDFEVSVGTNGDDRITFTQVNAPTSEAEEVDPSMKVTISGASTTQPSAAVKDVQELAAGAVGTAFVATDTIKIGDTTYTVVADTATPGDNEVKVSGATAKWIAGKQAEAYNANADAEYVAEVDNNGKITFTAKEAGAVGGDGPSAAPTAPTVTVTGTGAFTAGALTNSTAGADVGAGTPTIVTGISDYNVATTDQYKATAAGASRLASTSFELTKDMVEDGAKIKIGNTEYTFGKDVKIDDLDPKDKNYLDTVAERLTKAAAANDVWTVGHEGNRMTFTEIEDQSTWDLTKLSGDASKKEGIEQSFGFTGAAKKGGALTLQIGDSSDAFNQMKVEVGDMHVSAMKYTDDDGNVTSIADIDIGTQEGAQQAVDVIKNAINYVSSVRGDLGAIQNRLDHTANNLSVMAENIQDAESTIRDTDVAEEMMSYVKNNILVQSAQAMLAQANQVPQGVLQLLG